MHKNYSADFHNLRWKGVARKKRLHFCGNPGHVTLGLWLRVGGVSTRLRDTESVGEGQVIPWDTVGHILSDVCLTVSASLNSQLFSIIFLNNVWQGMHLTGRVRSFICGKWQSLTYNNCTALDEFSRLIAHGTRTKLLTRECMISDSCWWTDFDGCCDTGVTHIIPVAGSPCQRLRVVW